MSSFNPSASSTTHDTQASEGPSPHHRYASRDERIRIHTLRNEGYMYKLIAERVGCTERQVGYALSHPLTPKKRSGRPPKLTEAQVDELLRFATTSPRGRLMSYA